MTNPDTRALQALADKVEAGHLSTDDIIAAFGNMWDDMFVLAAFDGSLDAAKALHETVLPGWRIHLAQETEIVGPDASFLAFVSPMDYSRKEHVFRPRGRHDNPARAWLIAILRALIAGGSDAQP